MTRRTGRLADLSTPPRRIWPDAVLHHGARGLVLAFLAVLAMILFPPVERMEVSRYEVNMVADEDIVAEYPFAVPKSADELERDQADARAAVPPTFNYRAAASDTMVARLQEFFGRLDTLISQPPEERDEPIREFLAENSIDSLTESHLEVLTEPSSFAEIRETALQAAREILPEGVAEASELQQFGTSTINIREGAATGEVNERSVPREEVLTARQFFDRAVEMLPASAPPDMQEILRLVLIQLFEYSLDLNTEVTQADREVAAQAVVTTKEQVLGGQVMVRAGDRIYESDLEMLEAHEEMLRDRGVLDEEGADPTPFVGAALLNLLILLVFGLLIYFFRPEIYVNFRWVLLIALLIAAYLGAGALIVGQDLPYELLPVAFVALSVAVLWDGRIALALAMVLAVLTGVQPGFATMGYGVTGVTLVGGAAAALSVRVVRRRAQTWVFSAIIAGAYGVTIAAVAMGAQQEGSELVWSFGAAGVNALLSAILAMGFLPIFEMFTGITTDQTLLEWADPNRSLLRRLSREAPGTYAHTINVSNLAEAAANAIGANGLLCRVGLYYHDIGKMLKPHYFVENQPDTRNPHDRLKPATSATIVKEHVTEGQRLARDGNVPDIVADFIPEHHGTQRISFFWEKAKQEHGEDALDPDEFTYPGPKPRSRETAIAMLADSVESATRVLQDPTPERVRDLIENIVDGKIADGQLDDSPLTLREIRQIKEEFIKVLSGIYHHRIDYPQTRHLTEAKPGGADEREPSDQAAPPAEEAGDAREASEAAVVEAGDVDEEERREDSPSGAVRSGGDGG